MSKEAKKVVAGAIISLALGIIYYFYGWQILELFQKATGISLNISDIRLIVIVLIAILVKVALTKIDKSGSTGDSVRNT